MKTKTSAGLKRKPNKKPTKIASKRPAAKNTTAKKAAAKKTTDTKPMIESIGNVSSASVLKATQKNWDEWVRLLDHSGARQLTHQEIVALLRRKYKLNLWWQQMVTGKYEIYIGRRIEGQNQKGKYSMTATKSLPVAGESLWLWLCSPEGLQNWLQPLAPFEMKKDETFEVAGEMYGEVRAVAPQKRIRLSWNCLDWKSKTSLQVSVVPRGQQRSMLVIQHDGLDSAKIKEEMREFWRVRIDATVEALTAK